MPFVKNYDLFIFAQHASVKSNKS